MSQSSSKEVLLTVVFFNCLNSFFAFLIALTVFNNDVFSMFELAKCLESLAVVFFID